MAARTSEPASKSSRDEILLLTVSSFSAGRSGVSILLSKTDFNIANLAEAYHAW
jgi:hypothetical protein